MNEIQLAKAMDSLMNKHVTFEKKLVIIIIEDCIKSYEKLIEQRKETINNMIQVNSILFGDDETVDVGKTAQKWMERQHKEVDMFKREMGALVDVKHAFENADGKVDYFVEALKHI